MIFLATLINLPVFDLPDWYSDFTDKDSHTSTNTILLEALWVSSIAIGVALPLNVFFFKMFIAASQEQKAQRLYEVKLTQERSQLLVAGRVETVAELRCLVFELATLVRIARQRYKALLREQRRMRDANDRGSIGGTDEALVQLRR